MPNPTTERIDEQLTREEVERIDGLAKKATPSPWAKREGWDDDWQLVCSGDEQVALFTRYPAAHDDAALVAALVNAWPRIRSALLGLESERVRRDALKQAADCVPTNWLDSLLTGPAAAIGSGGTITNRHIEALLRGVQDRIRALQSGSKP